MASKFFLDVRICIRADGCLRSGREFRACKVFKTNWVIEGGVMTFKNPRSLWRRALPRVVAAGLFALSGAAAQAGILQFRATALGGGSLALRLHAPRRRTIGGI